MHVSVRLSALALVGVLVTGCGAGDDPSAAPTSRTSDPIVPADTSSPADAATPSTATSSATPTAVTSATTLDEATTLATRDGFPLLAPTRLPDGWHVVSAEYGVEGRSTWELDLTDENGSDVGVRQARPDVPAAYVGDIKTYLGSGARPAGSVEVPPFGTWDRYEGVRHPRTFAVGELQGTNVILWADDAASLPRLAAALQRV